MIDLIALAYLAVAWVLVWPRVYRTLYRHHRSAFPNLEWDAGDRMFGVFWGGFVSLFWPVLIVGYVMWRVLRDFDVLARLER